MNGYRDYSTVSDYKKIKVGPKVLDDAVLELGSLNSSRQDCLRHPFGSKKEVLRALMEKDIPTLRAISNFYYHMFICVYNGAYVGRTILWG